MAQQRKAGARNAMALSVLLATSSLFLSTAALAQQRQFNIAAGEANSTIPAFALQSGIQIIAPADQLRGIQTVAVNGNIDSRTALERLLQSTGLEVASDSGSVVVLKVKSPARFQPASYQAAPAPARERPVVLAQAMPAAPPQSAQATSDIIVTGTRRLDRTLTESPVPVDVFDASALQTQAPADMNNVMKNLVPSFNVGRAPLSDGSSIVRPPTLRGLPPDEILVLVNGKRRHRAALVQIFGGSLAAGSQGVDLSQIPVIAVDRVEVLRDGAAAQYGSDAIAGVINYGLKRNSSGISLNARYGQFYRGDGENIQLGANVGLPLGEGFISTSAEFLDSKITAPGTQRAGVVILQRAHPDWTDIKNPANSIGSPANRAWRLFVNAGLPVGDNSEVYLFGNYGENKTHMLQNYRQSETVTGEDRYGTGIATYPASSGVFNTIYLDRLANGNYDATGRTWNVREIFPHGYSPTFQGKSVDSSIVGGYKGTTSFELNYDLSASYGRNRLDYSVWDTVNPSMGPDTPTSFYAGRLQEEELNFNADFSYAWEVGLASPLTVAFGGERRRDTYVVGNGDEGSYLIGPYAYQVVERPDSSTFTVAQQIGSNSFPGFGPDSAVDKSRTSWAAYLDVEGDLLENLSVGVALRHEDFSDFGTTDNWKATLRYAFNDMIAVRGAVSTGFRAPTVGQLFTTNISSGFIGPDPIETATLPPSDPASRFFGATTLQPEKSKNFSIGTVLTPGGGLTVTVDAYRIDVDDRIGLSGEFQVTEQSQRDQLRALGVANFATLNRLRYFTNAFATRTEGVDLIANHSAATDYGRFNTTFAGSYNRNKLKYYDPEVLTRERVGDIERSLPRFRANVTENWSLDKLGVTARLSYFGPWWDHAEAADGGDKKFRADYQLDLEVSYEVIDGIRLAAGAENILNRFPEKNKRAMGLTGVDGGPVQNWYNFTDANLDGGRYNSNSPLGIEGGFWYIRASMNF